MQILLLFLLLLSGAWARGLEKVDFHFLFGYQAFLKKDFGTCTAELERVESKKINKRLESKAALFLSICRAKLGDRKASAFQAVRIETKYLSSWDKNHYVRLKNFLNDDFNRALKERNAPKKAQYPLTFSLSPYAGIVRYPDPSQKRKAGFQGLVGSLSYRDWKFDFGFESFNLSGNTFRGFTQTQGHLAVSRLWKQSSLTGRYTNIASDTETQDGIQIYGIGATHRVFKRTKLFADGYYSLYPGSALGNLSVLQSILAAEQLIYRTPEMSFWIKAGVQQTVASSSQIRDGKSFIQEGVALRSFLESYLRIRSVTLGGGFWAGREVFGVRNDGLMVFSTPEEHLGGQLASLQWDASKRTSYKLLFLNENIRIEDIDSTAQTVLGTFTYHFY